MATTPKLDTMSLMFRRHPQVSDLHNPATDALITTAAVDGNWTVAEVTEFIIRGINRLLAESYTALLGKTGNLELAAEQFGMMFSEYVLTADSTSWPGAWAITRGPNEAYKTLPTNFIAPFTASWYPVGVPVTGTTKPKRVRLGVSPRYYESARTGLYPELSSMLGMFRDGNMTILEPQLSGAVLLADLTGEVKLTYLANQTAVTQGGATDVLLRDTWFQNVVNLAVTLIHTET
jgi:hypothetical protein